MTDSTPIQWRCKHCNERVDPTMSLCWNCGHDREGVAQPAMFVDEVDVDTSVCAACQYDLKGNPDATACPECGEPVPWEDCPVCGVRTSRWVMAQGCPACQATAEGRAFTPEVQRKQYASCPECQYDFRGRPEITQCPECGASIDRDRYETVVEPRQASYLNLWPTFRSVLTTIVLFLAFPVAAIVFFLSVIWINEGMAWAAILLIALWVVSVLGCIILVQKSPTPKRTPDHVERRPL